MYKKTRKSQREPNDKLRSLQETILLAPKNIENTIEKIENAYRTGKIDEHIKIQLLISSLFEKERVDSDYYSKELIKSGTTAVEAICNYIRKKDANKETVEMAKRYLSSSKPSLENVYKSPSGYFKIYYSLVGKNSVSRDGNDESKIPDYIKQIGLAFDNTKAITCESRGFRKPILDRGQSTFEILVLDLQGKYGITFPQKYYSNGNNKLRTASSFIYIDNNYSSSKGFKKSRDDCMKVTAAHEFFHAVQNAYNVDADSWWKEASATWNEDEIYNSVNDYLQYLSTIFSFPEKSLEQSSYSGVVFAKFLSENYGGDSIIRRIWDYQANASRNSINAIDKALREKYKSEDIGTVYNRFTACNYNPSQYYKEGHLWTTTSVEVKDTYSDYPVAKQTRSLNHLAANYELFKPPVKNPIGRLKINIENTNGKRIGFKIQKKRVVDNVCEIIELNQNEALNKISYTCEDFGKVYKEICLIPANLEKEIDSAKYTYEVNIL